MNMYAFKIRINMYLWYNIKKPILLKRYTKILHILLIIFIRKQIIQRVNGTDLSRNTDETIVG